ncbi:choice-of-anchor B family protein [Pontibacter sp. G13]|uniref:choice-of-anchor B family protein n=1 Tax=Pontibacter sp. G13 TaxID=3074898 RepID=UPI00288AFB68|nr:choice-of-anchor B family protein [Pontibacter sp. G13]WNJ18753.1 choice-of-anchor B family protein [Pontibacter sp. G13]
MLKLSWSRITGWLVLLLGMSNQAFAQDSLNMEVVYHWSNDTIPPAFFIDNVYNEIWGYYDPNQDREYAIMGSSLGTHIFDITDARIGGGQEVAFIPGKEDDMIHRDYKTKGNYLYAVADEHASSLQIIDLSFLPDSVQVVYDSDEHFVRAHNIWIEGDRLYACAPKSATARLGGMLLLDIAQPDSPVFVKQYDEVPGVHDMYSRNDTVYLNIGNLGLVIADLTDSLNYQPISTLEQYAGQGYNHSGWLSDDGLTYFFADENHGRAIKALDVSDPTDPEISYELSPNFDITGLDAQTISHNQLIDGDYLFSSYYYDGVQVFDVSNPDSLFVAGFYDTYPDSNELFYHGNWGVYPYLPSGLILASDMQYGLFVLEFFPNGPLDTTISSVEPTFQFGVNLFPNPVQSELSIAFEIPVFSPKVKIFDLMGRELFEKRWNGRQNQVNIGGWEQWPNGVYVVEIEQGNQTMRQKIRLD